MQAGQAAWPGPRQWTLIVIVNEAFCKIDYLIGRDISVTMCHRALALAQKQKTTQKDVCLELRVVAGHSESRRRVGAGVEHPSVPGTQWLLALSVVNGVKRERSPPMPRKPRLREASSGHPVPGG